ncbi:MAG: ABC transporter substrate-binding protein [Thermotogae bacterium]|nr:ABC transporter substrate-binding protein [Thermotogota bacterium]MCP5465487.1 ABC transporter substrate-binding protein [Thermotogota bacterium]
MKKLIFVFLVVFAVVSVFSEVVNPDTFFYATIGEPDTLDPHYAYDTASGEVLYNVYENLIAYDGGSMADFVPLLSTAVPSVENGYLNDDGTVYVFPIRKGVTFHNGDPLTPEDVEYSFERALVFSPAAGPTWMLFEPLFGTHDIESMVEEYVGAAWGDIFDADMNPKSEYKQALIDFFNDVIDPAVEVEGDTVVFRLPKAFGPFMNILSQSSHWSGILDKEWCEGLGLWDGNADGWWKHHDWKKEDSPLYAQTNGTGPFKLVSWDRAQQKVFLERNDNYWREPAKLKQIVIAGIDEWSTRFAMLQSGEADLITTPAEYLPQVEELANVTVMSGLPTVNITALSFNWEIKPESKYVGSGKLDGEGVPLNFFTDENVRLGFAYAFNYQEFIDDTLNGLGINVPTVLPEGFLGYDGELEGYHLDFDKATNYFKRAFRGQLWQKGFKMTILYNTGNSSRQRSAEILRDNLAKINPKFKVEVAGVQWPSYLDARKNGTMPVYIIGWLADYPDPHNFIFTYYHSSGDYGKFYGEAFDAFARRPQPEFGGRSLNKMIELASVDPDPKMRQKLYVQIQEFVLDHGLSMALYQPLGLRAQRSWVKGYYRNPIRPGEDYYSLSKSE